MTDVRELATGFWEGVDRGRLVLQRCDTDGHIRFPISDCCPLCLSTSFRWVPLSGRGVVLSLVTFHRAYQPEWADRVPYDVLLVQLEEGPRMFSGPAAASDGTLAIGDTVQVRFEETPSGSTVPVFIAATQEA